MDEYDMVVIGAGIYGLPAAKTYLQINPSARLLVLDAGESIGGTWSEERLYEGLNTNNLYGFVEYPDFPMDSATFGVQPGSHVPGTVINKYLTMYAAHFKIQDKVKLKAAVKSAELLKNKKWQIIYDLKDSKGRAKETTIVTSKMIIATGTTSKPKMPLIPGSEAFGGPLFHFKDISSKTYDVTAAKNVVVLGGSKSAADAAWVHASKGVHVDWVIRASGRGPGWLFNTQVSPFKLTFEKLALSRFMTFLSPSIDLDAYPTIRKFFHNTYLGLAFLKGFFGVIQSDLLTSGNYNDHPEMKKLIPPSNIYWSGTSGGVFNYSIPLLDLMKRGLIHVHNADVTSLSPHTVHLSTGEQLDADVLICATGWEVTPTFSILPPNVASEMGRPPAPATDPAVRAADAEVLRRFPELKEQPIYGATAEHEREQTISYQLHRGIVPPGLLQLRNVAYCGIAISIRGFLTSYMQALWVAAFLDGRLSKPLPAEEEARWDALLHSRYWRWRAPMGLGTRHPDMLFETLPYIDTLLGDLGLETCRKGGWREIFAPYGVDDYRTLVQEWMEKQKL